MKPFLHGKKNLEVAPLRPLSGTGVHGASSSTPHPAGVGGKLKGPSVEAVKEGDKIVRLVVTCVCGERVEVECLYSAGS
jgi:hypothetical protein